MPRAMITTRLTLLLAVLSLPPARVAAGPILSHSIEGAGSGTGENTNSGLSAGWLMGLGAPVAARPGGAPSSGVDRLLAQILSELPAGRSTGGVAGMIDNRVPSHNAPTPVSDRNRPAGSSSPAAGVSSTDRSVGSPTALGNPTSQTVAEVSAARSLNLVGSADGRSNDGEKPPPSSGHEAAAGARSSTPGAYAPINNLNGPASINQASAQVLTGSSGPPRASGTTSPMTIASQGTAPPASGGSPIPNTSGGSPIPNTGSPNSGPLPSSATSVASIPPGSGLATPSTGAGTPISQAAGATTSLPNPGAVAAAAQVNGATISNPSSGSVIPATPQAGGATVSTNGPGASIPQTAGAATTILGPSAAVPASAGSPIPTTGPIIDLSNPSVTGSAGGTSSSTPGPGGPAAGSSPTTLGGASTSTGPLIPSPNGPYSSGGASPQSSQPNAVGIITLAPSTPSPMGVVNNPAPPGANASQLNSALGGSNNLTTNPTTSASLLTPTPLGVSSPLPPIQASPLVVGGADPGVIGGGSDPAVLPQSIPEPGALALFAIVGLASAMRLAARQLRSRG